MMGDYRPVMLLGGIRDGEILRVDLHLMKYGPLVIEEQSDEPQLVPDDADLTTFTVRSPRYHTYDLRWVRTPDNWYQPVFVYSGVDVTTVEEAQIIGAIMGPWRAQHRRAAGA